MVKYPYNRQNINDDDINAVSYVLKSQFLTTGPKVDEFENNVMKKTGIIYNVACSSGTAALHLSLLSLGIGPGDEVIVPSISFVATANAVEYVGATPIFADVDPDTLLIDIESVNSKITKKTKAIIPVDMCGQKPDYQLLKMLDKDIYIIADAAHNFMGHDLESMKYIDIVCYSFHPVKLITTGEGGMVSTNNSLFYSRLKTLRNHGRSVNDMLYLGYNYRMNDFQAALGISQLNRVEDFLHDLINISERYLFKKEINKIALKRYGYHTNHLFVIKVENRQRIMEYLYNRGIVTQIHYKPIYEMTYYLEKYNIEPLENTEKIKNKILSIPIYPGLEVKDQNYIIEKLLNVI